MELFCLICAGCFAALGLLFWLLQRRRARRIALERNRYHMLAQFSSTYLFEYHYASRQLTLSDNLPAELGGRGVCALLSGPGTFRTLIHDEDRAKVMALYQSPPPHGQEVALEVRLRHRDGSFVWYACKVVAVYEGKRPALLMGWFEDIDDRKAREALLLARSTLDDLTGLLNRGAVILRIETFLASPGGEAGGALLVLDLDNFKRINDTYGHLSGDRALLLAAQVLRQTFRSGDILGRTGGDEFLVFLPGVTSFSAIECKANELCSALLAQSKLTHGSPVFTCSVGAALAPQDGKTYAALFATADEAMYRAKRSGKNGFYSIASGESVG